MSEKRIDVAQQFAVMPIVREIKDGPYSGECFREDYLVPALKAHDKVIVNLNGVLTLGSSFLEEAFGGLVRNHHFTHNELKKRLKIEFELESYVNEAWNAIKYAKPGKAKAE